jgi:uncharacterized protein
MHILSSLRIADIPNKGRGVVTMDFIAAQTVVECSPVIVMDAAARKLLDQTKLHDYIFVWGQNEDECCMAQGYISVYNHAVNSNCEYFMNFIEQNMYVKTVIDIEAGQELTINYNGDFDNDSPVWFDTLK